MRGYIYKVSDWLQSVHKNNCRRRNLIGKITEKKKLIGHVPCAFIYRFTEHKQWAAKCIFHDFQTTTKIGAFFHRLSIDSPFFPSVYPIVEISEFASKWFCLRKKSTFQPSNLIHDFFKDAKKNNLAHPSYFSLNKIQWIGWLFCMLIQLDTGSVFLWKI